jgi:hypothetical protein
MRSAAGPILFVGGQFFFLTGTDGGVLPAPSSWRQDGDACPEALRRYHEQRATTIGAPASLFSEDVLGNVMLSMHLRR